MKKKILFIFLIVILLAASFSAGFSVTKSQATVVFLPFGGHLVLWIPCTCSGALWEFYVGAQPSSFPAGALAYVPYTTLLYSNYNMVTPGVWHLGYYIPGVQSCWMYAGYFCFPLPVIGTEVQVGTSLVPVPFE